MIEYNQHIWRTMLYYNSFWWFTETNICSKIPQFRKKNSETPVSVQGTSVASCADIVGERSFRTFAAGQCQSFIRGDRVTGSNGGRFVTDVNHSWCFWMHFLWKQTGDNLNVGTYTVKVPLMDSYTLFGHQHHIISESIMDFPCPLWLVYVLVPWRVIEDCQ